MSVSIADRFGRPLEPSRFGDRSLQPAVPVLHARADYAWLPRETLLSFEETATIIDAFTGLGVDRVRITGGEPLLRRNLPALVRQVAALPGVRDLALTTNGVLLAEQAVALREAGLHRITVSLDTLHRKRFEALTRFDMHASVLAGIDAATRAGYSSLKIDTVVVRGVNDDELIDLIEYGRSVGAEVRFIEYMDVGGATRWTREAVVSQDEMLQAIGAHYGAVTSVGRGSAPADRFALPDGTRPSASSRRRHAAVLRRLRSQPADGRWCLADVSVCARRHGSAPAAAGGATEDDLAQLIRAVWSQRADRGAEERLALGRREPLIPLAALKKDAIWRCTPAVDKQSWRARVASAFRRKDASGVRLPSEGGSHASLVNRISLLIIVSVTAALLFPVPHAPSAPRRQSAPPSVTFRVRCRSFPRRSAPASSRSS